jgi:hypothetical protein
MMCEWVIITVVLTRCEPWFVVLRKGHKVSEHEDEGIFGKRKFTL